MYSNFKLTKFCIKIFSWVPLKIYLHEYLTHEYFHTRKFPDLRYKHYAHIYIVPLKDTSPGLRVCMYMCYSVLKLCNMITMFIIGLLGRAWVSLTLMYIANGTVPMHEEPQQKTRLQHTTTVWYIGSCTNKHDKLMDTSIRVLSNAKICSFV